MKRLVYAVMLVAASCALMAGSATRPAVALESSNPVLFTDCLYPAGDCCNPGCRAYITGCCVNNSCGMPVQPVVYSKWGGLAASCSAVLQPLPSTSTPKPPAPPPPGARPKG